MSEAQPEYNLILAGFLPTNMMKASNGKSSLRIDDLLYGGGLKNSNDKTIKLWQVSTGQEVSTLTGHTNSVNSVAFSPDGQIIATGSADKTIKIWRQEAWQNVNVYKS